MDKSQFATITFRPYDLLKAVGRSTGGKNYHQFKAAIARLQGTRIETTIRRRDKERMEVFNLLADYTLDEDDHGRPLGAQMTLPARGFTERSWKAGKSWPSRPFTSI